MGKKLQILVPFKRIGLLVLLYFWGLFLGGGCQRQAANLVQNSAPLASAGPTQNVISGQVVVLDGSASLDPTGESLQYLWVQTAGVSVALNGTSSVITTFVAPDTTGILTFQLTVTNQSGFSAVSSVNILVNIPATVLFVSNSTGNSISSFSSPILLNGDVVPTTILNGTLTQIANPEGLSVLADGGLLVANVASGANSIATFNTGVTANGNTQPSRIVQGASTRLGGGSPVARDFLRDLLFVPNNTDSDGKILVFANVSTNTFNGDVAPTRIITSAGVLKGPNGINGLALDQSDNLYVANNSGKNILVFSHASLLDGDNAPSRTITSLAITNPLNLALDNRDDLLVVNAFNSILIFKNVSTLNGLVVPDATIVVPGTGVFLSAIAVDTAGTGYITDSSLNAIYEYDQITTRDGLIAPDRTIQGPGTSLAGPNAVFLLEQK